MLTLDIIVGLIFLIFTIRGMMRGLARELCGLFSLLFSLLIAHALYIQLSGKIIELLQVSSSVGIFMAFILIFAGIYILFFIALYFIQIVLKSVHLGFIDKIAGAIFGFAKIFILLVVVSLILSQFPFTNSFSCSLIKKSHIYAWVNAHAAKKQILSFIIQYKGDLNHK
jgi:membrane protein required for colicin V production